jgi:hypothetical protein
MGDAGGSYNHAKAHILVVVLFWLCFGGSTILLERGLLKLFNYLAEVNLSCKKSLYFSCSEIIKPQICYTSFPTLGFSGDYCPKINVFILM